MAPGNSTISGSLLSTQHELSHVGAGAVRYGQGQSSSIRRENDDSDPTRHPGNAQFAAMRGNDLAYVPTTSRHKSSECADLGVADLASTMERTPLDSHPSQNPGEPLDEFLNRYFVYPGGQEDEESSSFLPRLLLEGIITEETTLAELRNTFPTRGEHDLAEMARKVCGTDLSTSSRRQREPQQRFRQVFAILVKIDKVMCIEQFLDPKLGINDSDLPLERVRKEEGTQKPDLRRLNQKEKPIPCFARWRSFYINSFYDCQWKLLLPFFSKSERGRVRFQQFHKRIILPFTSNTPLDTNSIPSVATTRNGKGGFGEVRKVKIHRFHHNFQEANPLVLETDFAVKRLNSQDRDAFENEVEMLHRFSYKPHPHLIQLLTTWEQNSFFYLLFPCADCDLLRYWERRSQMRKPETALWVMKQCLGIADGLSNIHNYTYPDGAGANAAAMTLSERDRERLHGRHGDIKPENILWFSREPGGGEGGVGRLVISDFGCGAFNTRNSCSNIPNENVPNTPTYRPPEADIKDARIGRSWDIWTLGCVYLEFLTWLLDGVDLTRRFSKWRLESSPRFDPDFLFDMFFSLVTIEGAEERWGAVVKPQVTRWIAGLHNHEACTDLIHDFLDLIQREMIIVESADGKRATCDRVRNRLREIERKCQSSVAYYTKATQRALPDENEDEQIAVVIQLTDNALESVRRNNKEGDRKTLKVHRGKTVEGPVWDGALPRTGATGWRYLGR